jgi:hypothetical protein
MQSLHVLTVTPGLPVWLLDHLLTRVEQALDEAGASRIWISAELPQLAVMADLPRDAADTAPPRVVRPAPRAADEEVGHTERGRVR